MIKTFENFTLYDKWIKINGKPKNVAEYRKMQEYIRNFGLNDTFDEMKRIAFTGEVEIFNKTMEKKLELIEKVEIGDMFWYDNYNKKEDSIVMIYVGEIEGKPGHVFLNTLHKNFREFELDAYSNFNDVYKMNKTFKEYLIENKTSAYQILDAMEVVYKTDKNRIIELYVNAKNGISKFFLNDRKPVLDKFYINFINQNKDLVNKLYKYKDLDQIGLL